MLGAISDSVSITHSQYKFPITNIQTANSTESTQIALEFKREIESFELYQSDAPPEILLSLRFPVDEIFVQAEKGNISKQTFITIYDKFEVVSNVKSAQNSSK